MMILKERIRKQVKKEILRPLKGMGGGGEYAKLFWEIVKGLKQIPLESKFAFFQIIHFRLFLFQYCSAR